MSGFKKRKPVGGDAMERRRAVRYKVQASVDFTWGSIHGVGYTYDVSVGGTYVVCPNPPTVGTIIEIEVRFAGSSDFSPGLTIRSKGRVVRVGLNSHTGFAVAAKLNRLARRSDMRSHAV